MILPSERVYFIRWKYVAEKSVSDHIKCLVFDQDHYYYIGECRVR